MGAERTSISAERPLAAEPSAAAGAAGTTAPSRGHALDIERDSDVPISTQIYWQLAYQIESGRLQPGTRLPPVRELGAALRVNPNTIRAVYRRLADANYVIGRHGAGTRVVDRPPVRRGADALAGIVAETLRRAAQLGFTPDEVAQATFTAATEHKRPGPHVRVLFAECTTADANVVHSHTWYANMGGQFAKLLYDIPHVLTAHSLEPLRPWKAEQLGGGYRISSWAERTAYMAADAVIAVSEGMRTDVLATYPEVDPTRVHVVHNGIDCSVYRPDSGTDGLSELGVDPTRPYALFVGRITRQKGIAHLLRAARHFDPDLALVLCASSPDTQEIGEETAAAVAEL
ncbi:MAG: glycosyltransferase, partial [Chloroflexota bacterium]